MEALHQTDDADPAPHRKTAIDKNDLRVVTLRPAGLFWCVTGWGRASAPSMFDTRREAKAAAVAFARRLSAPGVSVWLETYDRDHALVSRVRYVSETAVDDPAG